ncbi:TonB-linked outer membrane protein, SusC/RagA family [Mesonia phycicola]|uniref:TonB-linked outer membrane protein, SusC/RagA family n=1 Tax=Mesonia phycicola TaxID=579105 RepID=A0A1M6BF52_9FLAO|nr:SusC/RagA family TonB-linked outer membrane protein [Mesonia phycicola]SHI47316.1 TonB-linked outer membrane protein, SusC/RagA family [Mesonia phycicola]
MKFLFRSCLRLSIFLVLSSWAIPCTGQQQISGTVTNTDNMPIPGVNITFKNKPGGTTTNFDGEYELNVQAQDSLVFAYLGYQTQTIAVANQSQINITLQEEENSLGDLVINAGYYTTTDRERTGSIEKVSAEEIELQPVVNPLQALQGRMPGVEVVQQSGVTGLAASIQIRGQNSLRNSPGNNGNQPLFIVDGVPINSSPVRTSGLLTNVPGLDPLNVLNLANIESIEVLKDADATAIYGSRGANGVVLITTKKPKGQQGKLQVNARLYAGFSQASHKMELLNTSQYLQMRQQAFANDGEEPTLAGDPDVTRWDQNRYTDWQEVLFGNTAEVTNMNLALSAGDAYTSFILGGGYHKEGSVFPGDFGYQKATANINLTHRSKDNKLKLNFSTNYGVDQNDLFNDSFVGLALTLPPNAPELYDSDGNLNWEESTWSNPLANHYKTQQVNSNNLMSNMNLSYRLVEGLDLKTNLGYASLNSEELIKNPIRTYDPQYWANVQASSTHSTVNRSSWIIEPQLVYETQRGNFNLEALAGLSFQNTRSSTLISVGQGYSHESLIGNLAAADQVRVNVNENIDYRYMAAFGRLGVNWKEKYFLNFTGRRDGSSRFGRDKRFANFGAIGGAWLFSEETFFKEKVEWLNFGKLRASYGTTGSDQIPDYGYLDTYQPTTGPGGLYATQLVNPDYSWEVNKKLETAVEVGLLENRLQVGVSWYRNRSSNQLVGYPLPATTGFATVQANLPAVVENTGWEFSLSTTNIKTKNFQWQSNINLTIPQNKLIEFDGIEETAYQNIYRVGEPLDIAILFQYEGIDPETGFYQIRDVNEDGSYNYDDRIVIKNLGRKYYAGINNTFTYKGVALSFLWQYVQQDNYTYFAQSGTPGFNVNQPVEVLDAWQGPGDNSSFQQYSQNIPAFMAHYNAIRSDRAVDDASFLRLKTLSLSYNLSPKAIEKTGLQGVRLFAHGQNLLTFTNYLGLDPEGGLALPPLRSFTFGLEVKF